MITQEQAEEYMQVASLVCMDLDLLLEIAEHGSISTKEELVKQIKHTIKRKDRLIADPKYRRERYGASSLLWDAVAKGQVRSDPFE